VKHVARKRFGQHFLTDGGIIDAIVREIAPKAGDAMVEIGPGLAALTQPLVERLGRLTVIELDRDLAQRLRGHGQLDVIESDVLKVDFAALAGKLAPAPLRVVGNLPYNISTPLLFHLARYAERVRDMHFMLQLEVVERMVAAPSTPEYGRLSVALQARFRMKKLFNVSKGAFRPPPKVESAVIRLEPLAQSLEIDDELLRRAFSARRKTLRNALPEVDFAALGIDRGLRPENLSALDYERITRSISRRRNCAP